MVGPLHAANLAGEEAILEGRLRAPCCDLQTLDVHESPIAVELRAEIHRRLAGGESAEAIENDLVERYGESIRAAPKGRDTRVDFAAVVGLLSVLAGAAVVTSLRKNGRRKMRHSPVAVGSNGAYDARIDDELRHFEE
jgi:cytochrome c-type biogenesis protein CcmH